jgi:hypothetical protein
MRSVILTISLVCFTLFLKAQNSIKTACVAKSVTVNLNNVSTTYNIFYNADNTIAAFTNDAKNDIVFNYEIKQGVKLINKVNFYEAGNLQYTISRDYNSNKTIARETLETILFNAKGDNSIFGVRNVQKFAYVNEKLTKIELEEYDERYAQGGFKTSATYTLFTTHPDLKKGSTYRLQVSSNTEQGEDMKINEARGANLFLLQENKAFSFLLYNGFGLNGKSALDKSYFLCSENAMYGIASSNNPTDVSYTTNYGQTLFCNKNYLSEALVTTKKYGQDINLNFTVNYDCNKDCAPNKKGNIYRPIKYNPPVLKATSITEKKELPAKDFLKNITLFQNYQVNAYNELSWGDGKKVEPLCCNLFTASFGDNTKGRANFITCTDKSDGSYQNILFPNGKSVYLNITKEGSLEYKLHGFNIYQNKKIEKSLQIEYEAEDLYWRQPSKEVYVIYSNELPIGTKTFKYFYSSKAATAPDSCLFFEDNNEKLYSRIIYNTKKGNVISASIFNSATTQEINYTITTDKNKFNRFNKSFYFNYQLGIMDASNYNLLYTVFAITGDAITDITPANSANEKAIHFDYGYVKNNSSYLTSMIGSDGLKNIFDYTCNYSKPVRNIPPPTPTNEGSSNLPTPIDSTAIEKPTGTTEEKNWGRNRIDILAKIYGKWDIIGDFTELKDCNGDGKFEIIHPYRITSGCKDDDLIEFTNNGKWIKTDNIIICDPAKQGKVDEGNWALDNDNKTMKFKLGMVTIQKLIIEKLTDTEMVLTKTLTEVKDDTKKDVTCTIKYVYSYKRP